MTNYREIIRLKCQGYSERNIALSCNVSRNTVSKVCKAAAEQNISWSLSEAMTDAVLENMLFPSEKSATNKRMPNYDYIRRELQRNGVNKKLLWTECCEECSQCGEEPHMYSQFCYYLQQDEQKRRAKKLIKNAHFEQSGACIAAIDYGHGRKLNKSLINELATCEYIGDYRNIFITGATGSGKTYMACAFGMEACKQNYTVKYIRMPDLLLELQAAAGEANTFVRVL